MTEHDDMTRPRRIGCYRRGDRWECHTIDDMLALLRLADDGLPIVLVAHNPSNPTEKPSRRDPALSYRHAPQPAWDGALVGGEGES